MSEKPLRTRVIDAEAKLRELGSELADVRSRAEQAVGGAETTVERRLQAFAQRLDAAIAEVRAAQGGADEAAFRRIEDRLAAIENDAREIKRYVLGDPTASWPPTE